MIAKTINPERNKARRRKSSKMIGKNVCAARVTTIMMVRRITNDAKRKKLRLPTSLACLLGA